MFRVNALYSRSHFSRFLSIWSNEPQYYLGELVSASAVINGLLFQAHIEKNVSVVAHI